MKHIVRLFFLALTALFISGCASVQVADYAKERPKFDLHEYFNGRVIAHGIVQDRSGKVVRRMTVDMACTWVGDTGTLNEDFTYSDGKKERRIWTIKKQGDRYIGTAADVVGEAIGEAAGNALNWKYVLALPVDDKIYNVDFDDWMWQLDDKVMMNRAEFSKFGFKLGEVLITFYKQ
ncbi:MAG: DUF3833 domain-containing protein [Casimicrobium sp.]